MKISTTHVLIGFGVILLAMMACLPLALLGIERNSPDASATQFAATVQAMLTQNAPQVTQIVPTQSVPTQVWPTATPTTIVPTRTPLPPATPVSYCYLIKFVRDVSVPDGSVFAPGESFTKTWRLQNAGTCGWTTDTKVVFVNGSQMSGPSAAALPGYVAPGQMVDVSVTLTAPSKPGKYTGYWMMRSPDGIVFGSGAGAEIAFFVEIKVERDLAQGGVTGSLCYPSEFNPPLILYFENAASGEVIQFAIPEAQNVYSVALSPGTYYAYAWAPGYDLEGAYADRDGSLKSFIVRGGETTPNIDICNWTVRRHGQG
ncbi:MAG: NBR1-Ig-like domain-containing protein [Bacteroidota bacterium]